MTGGKILAACLCAALTVSLLAGCGSSGTGTAEGTQGTAQGSGTSAAQLSASDTASPRTPAELDLTGATEIQLSGTEVSITGSGATAEDGVVTITAGGTYVLRGSLTDGRVIVNAKGEQVTLALDGADITCSYQSALYIYKSEKTILHLMAGTENSLTDGASYVFSDEFSSQEDEEPNACLYSKSDLVLQGAGSLTVNGNFKNGVTGKDTLEIYDGNLTVNAVNNGITGKDSCAIDSASVTVDCGGDAIRSTNDSDETLGWVTVSNSALALTAGEDGIQGETTVTMSSGTYAITTGGGNGGTLVDDDSAKGVKGGTAVALCSGVYTLDCCDDAVHSNGNVTVSGGVYTVSSGDDAFHADETLTVDGGEIEILTAYEGLEGVVVNLNGGNIVLTASDDGVNAGGGTDGSGFMGRGKNESFGETSSAHSINITGGYLVVHAGGDGLDSNGSITMTGGTVLSYSTGRNDGALDYDSSFTISGGTLLAAGSGMMPQAPSQAEQKVVFLNFDTTLPADTCVALTGDGQEFAFTLPIETANLVYSSPELTDGGTYTVSYGGTYSGEAQDGICSGGSYSGGTELTEVTLTEDITTYGNSGMGGGMGGGPGGGFDGKGGKGGMGGKNDTGDRPELPDNGTPPGQGDGETPPELPDGENMPDRDGKGERPELPDGGNMPDRDGKGERPELPDGGNMPDRGGRGERPGQTEQNKT